MADQAEANVDALDVSWTEGLDGRVEGFAEDRDEYWKYRSKLSWT